MKAFPAWPSYTEEEADAVRRVLLSNEVNQWTGPHVEAFEQEFAGLCGVSHALAVSNGSVALEVALSAARIGPGDEVIVTPRSFIASASSVVRCGATAIFADVDSASGLITPETVAPLLTEKTRAIVCVHLSGWPCDMDGFRELVRGRQIVLVEDCAQAHGASYRGKPVGGLGDIAAWSFCQDKIITTGGEGGMVTTNDTELYRRAWSLRDHGKDYVTVHEKAHPPGFRWQHEHIGTNCRMTSMQAVIGSIQIGRLSRWHAARRRNAGRIREAASEWDVLDVPDVPVDVEHAWYRCELQLNLERLSADWSRNRVLEEVGAQGIPCLAGPCPEIYLEKAFTSLRTDQRRLPVAQALGERSIVFLVHPTIGDEDMERVIQTIDSVASRVTIG